MITAIAAAGGLLFGLVCIVMAFVAIGAWERRRQAQIASRAFLENPDQWGAQ